MRARVRGSTSAVRRCERVEFIDSSHIDGFCSSGLPLSSHPSLRSFCSSLSSRSFGLFASRVRRSLFTFSSSSSSSSSFVLVRYEGLKTSYHGHACFPKRGPIGGAGDSTRIELHLNKTQDQIAPRYTRTTRKIENARTKEREKERREEKEKEDQVRYTTR